MYYKLKLNDNKLTLPFDMLACLSPSRYGETVIVTASVDRAISLYSIEEWRFLEAELMRLPTNHPEIRHLQRLLIGNAFSITITNTGEIELPEQLTRYAGIQKEAVAIIFDKKIEIWNGRKLGVYLDKPIIRNREKLRKTINRVQVSKEYDLVDKLNID